VPEYGVLLTRIAKDVNHGEFNIAFYNLNDMPIVEALNEMESRLDFFSGLYYQNNLRLTELLDQVTARMDDDRISFLIESGVRFHERVYNQHYTSKEGEYAV
jgi:hypothetical protein